MRPRSLLMMIPFLFISVSRLWAWTADVHSAFERGNQHYRQGQFNESVSLFQGLAEKNPKTAVFFYNLGNSYYRAGERGRALLAYERALVLAPRSGDTRKNLNYVRGLLEYRIEDKRNWYIRAGEALLKYFTEEEILFVTALAGFFFLAGWAFVLFFKPGLPWGFWRKAALVSLILSLMLAGAKHVQSRVIRDAIVMSKEAEGRYGPSESDQVAFRLGEGLKVYVVDSREGWKRVLLTNGESGWMRDDQIAEVRV